MMGVPARSCLPAWGGVRALRACVSECMHACMRAWRRVCGVCVCAPARAAAASCLPRCPRAAEQQDPEITHMLEGVLRLWQLV